MKVIGIVFILLARENNIKLHNVTLAPRCNSNLIPLKQLHKNRITYHDDPKAIVLIRDKEVITQAKRDRNLFTLNLA